MSVSLGKTQVDFIQQLRVARYHFTQQEECENFIGALKPLLLQVPLQVDIPEMLQQWQWFGEWSIGCVGILSDWVEDLKCSFLGPIDVTMQQFQESDIWHVECQNCGARRDMKKVKDRQKFPSHPPRKTPPPKGEERWVSREVGWKLVKD